MTIHRISITIYISINPSSLTSREGVHESEGFVPKYSVGLTNDRCDFHPNGELARSDEQRMMTSSFPYVPYGNDNVNNDSV